MRDEEYIRKVQTSVTNFTHCGDDYLFIYRDKNNGIGGKLEPGEDFLKAAIRETEEETGYNIGPEDIKLAGVVKLEGGYSEDWVMCFFKTKLSAKEIPKGSRSEDGDIVWTNKDRVLDSDYELVDDLNYCFKDIISGKDLFFMTAKVGENQKIYDVNVMKSNFETNK